MAPSKILVLVATAGAVPLTPTLVTAAEFFSAKTMFIPPTTLPNSVATPCVAKQINPRSGYLYLSLGSSRDVGYHSVYWSNSSYLDINNTFYLDFNNANLNPSFSSARWFSFLTRCLAKHP